MNSFRHDRKKIFASFAIGPSTKTNKTWCYSHQNAITMYTCSALEPMLSNPLRIIQCSTVPNAPSQYPQLNKKLTSTLMSSKKSKVINWRSLSELHKTWSSAHAAILWRLLKGRWTIAQKTTPDKRWALPPAFIWASLGLDAEPANRTFAMAAASSLTTLVRTVKSTKDISIVKSAASVIMSSQTKKKIKKVAYLETFAYAKNVKIWFERTATKLMRAVILAVDSLASFNVFPVSIATACFKRGSKRWLLVTRTIQMSY